MLYYMRWLILWLQKLVLVVNNLILAKNSKFGATPSPRFSRLSGHSKITKNAWKWTKIPKIPIWWPHIMETVENHVWNEFWDISGRKVLIKKNFRFHPEKAWFFKKKFQKAWNTLFWPWKPGWMSFPWSFNDKLVVGTQKEWGSKNSTYHKSLKM